MEFLYVWRNFIDNWHCRGFWLLRYKNICHYYDLEFMNDNLHIYVTLKSEIVKWYPRLSVLKRNFNKYVAKNNYNCQAKRIILHYMDVKKCTTTQITKKIFEEYKEVK